MEDVYDEDDSDLEKEDSNEDHVDLPACAGEIHGISFFHNYVGMNIPENNSVGCLISWYR